MSEKSREAVSARRGDKSGSLVREETPPLVPPPDQFESYDRILPGAADRMLSMAEKQQADRLERARKNNAQNHRLAARGQWLAALICFCSLAVAAAGVFSDRAHAAYLGAAAVAGVIALSLIARKK